MIRLHALLILTLCAFGVKAQRVFLFEPNSFFTDGIGRECIWADTAFNGRPELLCTCNNADAAASIGTSTLWPGGGAGLNLSGSGLNKLAVWDGGMARTSHRELLGRVMVMDSPTTLSSHTTAVVGNMIATGINPQAKGMSYATQLKNWNFANDNAEIVSAAGDLLLSNHSYATTCAWTNIGGQLYWYGDSSLHPTRDWKFGYYDNRSRIWDSIMYAQPYFLMVKASGNDRGNGVAPGTPHMYWNGTGWALSTTTRDTVGPYDCISTFGNAKNILCVGAVPTVVSGYIGNVTPFSYSTFGPTDDGRIKPDLVGPSGVINSVGSAHDSAYAGLGGTSIAAPAIASSLLLLQQYHQQQKGVYMRNASLKALAIHSARRCKPNFPGPDYECGWGIPNMAKALSILKDTLKQGLKESALNNQTSYTLFVYIQANDTFRSTLVWTDPKGVTGLPAYNDTSSKLVNDLDMRLLTLTDSLVLQPFVLNPSNPALPATTGNNNRDNVEQLFGSNLNPGWYKIVITHKGQLQASQPQTFSLVYSGANATTALPVSWLAIKAEQKTTTVCKISWATSTETNNDYFLVLEGESADVMFSFSSAKGKGNSRVINWYEAYHIQPEGFSKTHYYKVCQIDFDGKQTCSKTISFTPENLLAIRAIVPNPFADKFTVYHTSNAPSLTYEILNVTGSMVLNGNVANNADKAFEINGSMLAAGVYTLRLIEQGGNNEIVYYRLIKDN